MSVFSNHSLQIIELQKKFIFWYPNGISSTNIFPKIEFGYDKGLIRRSLRMSEMKKYAFSIHVLSTELMLLHVIPIVVEKRRGGYFCSFTARILKRVFRWCLLLKIRAILSAVSWTQFMCTVIFIDFQAINISFSYTIYCRNIRHVSWVFF